MSKQYKEQEEKNLGKNSGSEKDNRKKEAHQGQESGYKKEERGQFGQEHDRNENRKSTQEEE